MSKQKDTGAKYLKILSWLVTPAAIGLYIGISFFILTLTYYNERHQIRDASAVLQIIDEMVSSSNDFRMQFRGLRPGHPDVAILAIDDESLEEVGRWPWPRDKMAMLFNNALKYNAKVIAADIVWSEKSHRPELQLMTDYSHTAKLNPEQIELLERSLEIGDADRSFAKTMTPLAEKFIFGHVYQSESDLTAQDTDNGYQSKCFDIAFQNTPAGKLWTEIDSTRHIVVDQTEGQELPFPQLLKDLYKELPDLNNNTDTFCANLFLEQNKDPLWEDLSSAWTDIKTEAGLEASSFTEWATDFKSRIYSNEVLQVSDWLMNIEDFRNISKNNGYFNARLDSDSTIRRGQLIARNGSTYFPSIAFKAFLVANNFTGQINLERNYNWGTDKFVKGAKSIDILNDEGEKQFTIPVGYDGSMLINYAGPQKMFAHIRASDLINDKIDTVHITQKTYDPTKKQWLEEVKVVNKSEYLKNKIMVAGVTAIGVFDLRVIPFADKTYPGVETHANVIDNLMRRDFLRFDENEAPYMLATIALIGLILALALSHMGSLAGLLFTFSFILLIFLIDKHLLFSRGIVAGSVIAIIQVISTYMFMTFYKYFTEERNKKALRQTFSKYVSPQIVDEILRDPKNLQLGGRKERITVFFSDLRGFTTISEKLDPKDLSDLLNQYLTPMTDLVFNNSGTLDKYMGDAIMAFFGAPVPFKDHAKYAARCALDQMKKLKELQAEFSKKGLPHIDIGIGLNTGECSVGNMGSETVRNYTVMGDAVNLASRLEGINKEYGTHIIISESTYEEVKSDFTCREVDLVKVKGKNKPVKIYELMSEGPVKDNDLKIKECFSQGYKLYHAKRFDEAIQEFKKCADIDPTSKIYLERCEEYINEPPPENWDGVFVMKTK